MADKTVNGKVILITGAGAGFGRKMAQTFAADGASLVLTDINQEAVNETAGLLGDTPVATARHDVSSEADWAEVVKIAEDKFGRLDGLVNNAGFMLTKPFLNTSLEEFRRLHAVNVESIWIGVQACFPLLQAGVANNPHSGASVVNISSVFGQVAGFAQAGYSTTKGAVTLLTKCQAFEFAKGQTGVRVNSVHPGPGNTALAENGVAQMIEGGMVETPDQALEMINAMIPAGRFAEPEDVADLVLFLCSDASRYCTGSEFTVDGGYSAV